MSGCLQSSNIEILKSYPFGQSKMYNFKFPLKKDDKILSVSFPQNKAFVISSGLTAVAVNQNEKAFTFCCFESVSKCAREQNCGNVSFQFPRVG